MTKLIIDSELTQAEALAQNPEAPCPVEILDTLRLLSVRYLGFEGLEHRGQIVVAKMVAGEVETFFRQALALRFPIEKVVLPADKPYRWDDQKLMADNATSGFNYRLVAGTSRISQHASGLAIDVNTRINPCIRLVNDQKILVNGQKTIDSPDALWDKEVPGTLYADHPLVRLMESLGWEWGGHWTLEDDGIIDYQHFQKLPRS